MQKVEKALKRYAVESLPELTRTGFLKRHVEYQKGMNCLEKTKRVTGLACFFTSGTTLILGRVIFQLLTYPVFFG
jgi:hypothetical protein